MFRKVSILLEPTARALNFQNVPRAQKFQNVLVIVHLNVCTQIQSTLITNNLKGQREKLMCYNKLPLQNIIFRSSSVFYFCTSV